MTESITTPLLIREPQPDDAQQLAAMLCADHQLRAELGIPATDRPTAQSFLHKLAAWCSKHHATTFAIVVGHVAVGTISLSHRSDDGSSARIGYWVGSEYRRRGYCTQAFAAVLRLAAAEGVMSVSAAVADANTPSQRVWQHFAAKATPTSPSRTVYTITLPR